MIYVGLRNSTNEKISLLGHHLDLLALDMERTRSKRKECAHLVVNARMMEEEGRDIIEHIYVE